MGDIASDIVVLKGLVIGAAVGSGVVLFRNQRDLGDNRGQRW